MRNGVKLTTHAAANYMRGEKSYNLRRRMSVVDMLVGGYDEAAGPSLYFIDYLASMQKLDKASPPYPTLHHPTPPYPILPHPTPPSPTLPHPTSTRRAMATRAALSTRF